MEKDMSREACRKAYQERQDILAQGITFATFYGRVQQYGWSYDKAATTPLGGEVKANVKRRRPRGKYNPNDLLLKKEQIPSKEELTQDITTMSIVKICKKYGITPNMVKKLCIEYNIWDLRKNKKGV